MGVEVQLQDVRQAWEARDPDVVQLIETLIGQPLTPPDQPTREGAYTFEGFLQEISSPAFRRKSPDEQAHFRVEQVALLESADAELPLPDRYRAHEVILALWEATDEFARRCLLQVIQRAPLSYGAWRALKRIFKEAEARNDSEILGALAARFDMAAASQDHAVSQKTLLYLCRRAWRYLRRIGETLPAAYADVATDFLAHYTDDTRWTKTWIANHIFYHETGQYSRTRFRFRQRPSTLLKHRAYGELWRRSPRPLFALLERARCEQVWRFATTALKSDFRATLRDVEPSWVGRLVQVGSSTIDEFVVWILKNVPRFEQSAFRELGLHEPVLKLFDSPARSARDYAAEYARTHARDLPVERLVRLADNDHAAVRKLAHDLLQSRDPRQEVGLEAWGRLLETRSRELAEKTLRKHFGAKELTPDWFRARLLAPQRAAFEFARAQLTHVHPTKSLGHGFFCSLIEEIDLTERQSNKSLLFVLEELEKFDLNALETDTLQRLLVNPACAVRVCQWVQGGKLKAQAFPVDFLKVIAFHPAWDDDAWLSDIRQTQWGKNLEFDGWVSEQILGWLGDVRLFSPDDLGFDWLMQLVERSESRYHKFAVETMIKAFLPADFAAEQSSQTDTPQPETADEINVDLGGASFVFTGKLATMTRSQAQGKVTAAGGANASTVNKKLSYLVIGDEGSPMYGQGRKGSKQLKGEKLNTEGGEIKIISETAFLQMLAGEQREFSEDAIQAGCERLWEMLTAPGKPDAPLSEFAREYIRRHHPDICLKETDRPVDPGAEVPEEFLSFDQVKPLFFENRTPLRELALELAHWEFARWAPPIEGIIDLCEAPHDEVREFVANAITADDSPQHSRYRVDPAVLTPDAVYSFCESRDEATRALGMALIELHPRLRLPEELFRLTESPDRQVRAFVVRAFWSLYRNRHITGDWKPQAPPQPQVGRSKSKSKAQTATEDVSEKVGTGPPPRPDNLPASFEELQDFLRRSLFEIPPGKPDNAKRATISAKLKPLPARKAKLLLIEVLRDLAVEDEEFATAVTPLLQEFLGSRGQSEMEACLVAVTRIRRAFPNLVTTAEEVA